MFRKLMEKEEKDMEEMKEEENLKKRKKGRTNASLNQLHLRNIYLEPQKCLLFLLPPNLTTLTMRPQRKGFRQAHGETKRCQRPGQIYKTAACLHIVPSGRYFTSDICGVAASAATEP